MYDSVEVCMHFKKKISVCWDSVIMCDYSDTIILINYKNYNIIIK